MKLLIATRNRKKRQEFEMMLAGALPEDVEVSDTLSWPESLPEVVEDRDTFVGNAVKKAVETSLAAGVCAMSEDSGLEVDALSGAPGVYSARFSGADATDAQNNAHLIDQLRAHPGAPRTARYVATICLALMPGDDLGAMLIARLAGGRPISAGAPDRAGVPGRVGERVVAWWRGELEGEIVDTPRGEGGFGYDPHFEIPRWGRTAAEVSAQQKNSVSHRGQALRAMARSLQGDRSFT